MEQKTLRIFDDTSILFNKCWVLLEVFIEK